jgi:uncharacterized protein
LTTFFVDTSALAKRYIIETGSTWIRSWIEPVAGNVIVASDITPVEMFSLFARREREGTLSPTLAAVMRQDYLAHVQNEYLSIGMNDNVLVQARDLVTRYLLRPPDAIQLASAIYGTNWLGEPMVFVCADQNLLFAAAGEGFTTDNPNGHP